MSEGKKEEGENKKDEASKGGKKKLFIIIGAISVVVILAAVGLLMMGGSKDDKSEDHEEEKAKPKHYVTAPLPTIIVNLSDSTSFLKLGLLLEYDMDLVAASSSGEAHAGGGGKSESAHPAVAAKREPMIKDAIIHVVAAKKAEELLTNDGKERLKEELIEAINGAIGLEEGPVVAIYFTEFIIQ